MMKLKLFGLIATVIIVTTTQGVQAQEVGVADTQEPMITLIGDDVIQLTVGDTYIDQGATAIDDIDGDLTEEIIVTGAVINTDTAGTYFITYNVSDAAGNDAVELERAVTVNTASDTDDQEIETLECDDAPPLGNNKGWDGVGNCHVNGEPWIPGISDQPGYEVGDTAVDEEEIVEEDEPLNSTSQPAITIQAIIEGGDLTVQDLIFARQNCESDSIDTYTITTGTSTIVDPCYGTNLPEGAFQPEGEFYLISTPQDYDITIGGTRCDEDGIYSVQRGFGGAAAVDAICTYTFTYAEPLQIEDPLNEEDPIEEVVEEVVEPVVPAEFVTTAVEGDYTIITTAPSSLSPGEITTIEIELTNNSGPEEFVFYTFLSQVPVGADQDDEGAFTTDKFFEGQSLAIGESKTYSFTWLNDESVGDYKFFGEVKAVDWSETVQKSQIAQLEISGANLQSLGQTLHRFYSQQYKGHFYTTSEDEKQHLIDNDPNWTYEGIGHKTVNNQSLSPSSIQDLGIKPVYRFWNPTAKHHFYTVSEAEKEATIANPDWEYEAIAYYTYTNRQMDTIEVFRFYSPTYKGHFYTTSAEERDALIANDDNWLYEGIAWYAQR